MRLVEFNSGKLRGKIVEKYGTVAAFSKELGISEVAMHKFLAGKSDWNRQRIIQACEKLGVTEPVEFRDLFFSVKS